MRIEPGMKVLITGAAAGIGREIVRALIPFRLEFFLVDCQDQPLDQLADELRAQHLKVETHVCDLADPQQVEALAARVQSTWSELHILVNNAGVAWYGPTLKTPEAEWDRILAVNLHAPVRLTRRLLPLLIDQPRSHIVNLASICGLVAGPRLTAYSTSKFGLVGFSEALRGEFSRHGLGVTVICPGPVRTRMLTDTHSASNHGKIPAPPRWISTSPAHVAACVVRAIRREHSVVVISWLARLLFWIKSLAPTTLDAMQRYGRRKKTKQKLIQKRLHKQQQHPTTTTAPSPPRRAA